MRNAVPVILNQHDALIVVDVQNDFLPGGALAVPQGDKVILSLNQYIALFLSQRLPIYASRDWHPANHCSFKAQGGPWPNHCVVGTPGAAFSFQLRLPPYTQIISKAITPEQDAYSAFLGTPLQQQLLSQGVKRLFIGGLATDYCVKSTITDALAAGFEVFILTDAIAGISTEDSQQAIRQLLQKGAQLVTVTQLLLPQDLVA
jgi:nicotinamidase/pyrazinamidase